MHRHRFAERREKRFVSGLPWEFAGEVNDIVVLDGGTNGNFKGVSARLNVMQETSTYNAYLRYVEI